MLHLVDGDFGVASGKKTKIVNTILQSPLQRALHAGNVVEFRRCALQLVWISDALDGNDEESPTADSARDAASEAACSRTEKETS